MATPGGFWEFATMDGFKGAFRLLALRAGSDKGVVSIYIYILILTIKHICIFFGRGSLPLLTRDTFSILHCYLIAALLRITYLYAVGGTSLTAND